MLRETTTNILRHSRATLVRIALAEDGLTVVNDGVDEDGLPELRGLADLARPDRAALLFGTEGPGLPDSVLARADTVRIPMAAGFDSLNVATTSGIVLHHLAARDGRSFPGSG